MVAPTRAADGPPARRPLARAGWSVVRSSSKGSLETVDPPPGFEAEGKRLVADIATSWSRKYIYTIRHGGWHEGAYHYECLFSCPTNDVPVPGTVIAVGFAMFPPLGVGANPRMFYSFEEGDLRHEWALTLDAQGRHQAEPGQQPASLKYGSFESYLDAYIREKDKVRSRGIDCTTGFEASRLPPPPAFSYEESEGLTSESESQIFRVGEQDSAQYSVNISDDSAREMAGAMRDGLKAANMFCDKVALPTSLADLLANVFDAADEEGVGELPHHEVARVLVATLPGFGLEHWDIHHLLTSAQENDDGFIELKPFIQAAPELIQALRKRRMEYRARGFPGVDIPNESVKHCFTDEIATTVDALTLAFENCAQEDAQRGVYLFVQQTITHSRAAPNARVGDGIPALGSEGEERMLVALKRRYCRDCIQSLHDRLSPQESQMLMQMLPEDEHGFVHFDELPDRLEELRTQVLLNSVVETSERGLRTHLVLQFRRLGIDETRMMKVWVIKHALLQADQICLSRLQIHTLLCLSNPDHAGNVDVANFLGICCALVPHMCNARIFVETAERLQAEHAEAAKERQNAELAALGAARVNTLAEGGEEKERELPDVDQETVERTLIQVFSLGDDTRKATPVLQPDTIFHLLVSAGDAQVQSCGLNEFELTGLAAEMNVDPNGEVAYHEYVKRWVPIMFELRKNMLLGGYLKERAAENMGIPEPDMIALEVLFPLLPTGSDENERRHSIDGKHSSRRKLERRNSKDRRLSAGSAGLDSIGPLSRRGSVQEPRPHAPPYADVDGATTSRLVGRVPSKETPHEPPPGRGYQRRKNRLAAEHDSKQHSQSPSRSPSKESSPVARSQIKDNIVG